MSSYTKYLERLKSKNNNIEEYIYKLKTGTLSKPKDNNNKRVRTGVPTPATIRNHLISISKLFESEKQRKESHGNLKKDFNLKHSNVNLLTEQYIKDFIESDWWNNLEGATQKGHVNKIRNYFKYSEREDLINLLPTSFKRKTEKLSKLDLITREELKQILKYSNLKYKTLFKILYEGALRIDEALNLRKKDIMYVLNPKHHILKISKSKTYGRDIAVLDCKPYIDQYLGTNDFEPTDKLFDLKYNNAVNNYLNGILKKLIKKYPKQWKGRKIYPHLFRHSRLTELARKGMSESQLRNFAGWTADSTMAKTYIHLVDKDTNDFIIGNAIETPKPEPIEPNICEICSAENVQENPICWKCGNLISEENKEQIGIEIITQPNEIKKLKEELETEKQMRESLHEEINKLRDWIGVDDEEVKVFLKERHQKLKEEKSK